MNGCRTSGMTSGSVGLRCCSVRCARVLTNTISRLSAQVRVAGKSSQSQGAAPTLADIIDGRQGAGPEVVPVFRTVR